MPSGFLFVFVGLSTGSVSHCSPDSTGAHCVGHLVLNTFKATLLFQSLDSLEPSHLANDS